jgi:small GTP-binding protein
VNHKPDIDKLRVLSQNFLLNVPDTVGLLIFTIDGSLVLSEIKSGPTFIENISEPRFTSITDNLRPTLEELRTKFSTNKFASAVIESENYRIVNIAVFDLIVTFVLDILAYIDKIYPYAYLTVEKIVRIFENKANISLTIPTIGNISSTLNPDIQFVMGNTFEIKCILVGESNVGKTSIVMKFTHKSFAIDYRPTIGVNLILHAFEYLGNLVRMTIWDIGAHKYFKRIRQSYYAGANVALIVFDLTDKQSFLKVKDWYNEAVQFCGNVNKYLIGNKSDLTDKRQVTFEEGLALAEELKCPYLETSALNGSNVEDAFSLVACKLLNLQK